jgi:hypothetical protein
MWKKYKKKRTKYRRDLYNRAANTCKEFLDRHEKVLEHDILKSGDLGKFYKFVNSRLSSKTGIGPLLDPSKKFVFDSFDKAQLLNDYFAGVCTIDDKSVPPFSVSKPTGFTKLDVINFSSTETYKCLSKLKSSLSAGPDGIPPMFYKKLARCLAEPITQLNRRIFSYGSLPSVWKTAVVVPIFKKGCSSNVSNYRPISLTCVACKIFETSIKKGVLKHFLDNELLNCNQHGFISKHSTCTNLLESLNDWTVNLRNGSCTRVAFIDFARAFDTISFSKLLIKLVNYGIDGKLLSVIQSFLCNRSQVVLVNGVKSESRNIISGVPQGSVLGPLLFVLYINDISNSLPRHVSSNFYADDAKLYTEIKSVNDVVNFQSCLDSLSDWAKTWQLSISITKCSLLDVVSRKSSVQLPGNYIDSQPLEQCFEKVDLGVKIDCKLSFSMHISDLVAKAKQRIFLLFRSFKTRCVDYLLLAYKSYILPIVTYCSSIWSPYLFGDLLAVESVQRLFTRRLPGFKKLPYGVRLNKLQLPTLELRRLRTDLCTCYKIIHGDLAGPPERYGLKLAKSQRVTRGHDLKLKADHSRVDVRLHYFSVRIVAPWNSLSCEIVHASSACDFKKKIAGLNFSKYVQVKF